MMQWHFVVATPEAKVKNVRQSLNVNEPHLISNISLSVLAGDWNGGSDEAERREGARSQKEIVKG